MKIRTYIKILSIISLSICFNSCDNVEKAKDGYDRSINISDLSSAKPIQNHISEFAYIPLESNERTLFMSADKILFIDGLMYIGDFTTGKILAFDSEGKNRLVLNKHGRGPGEYIGIQSFTVDDSFIYVLDAYALRILKYSRMDAAFISAMALPVFALDCEVLSNGGFIFAFAPIDGLNPPIKQSNHRIFISDKDMNIIAEEFEYASGTVDPIGSRRYFTVYDEEITFYSIHDDEYMVFSRKDGKLQQKVLIDFKEGKNDKAPIESQSFIFSSPVLCNEYCFFLAKIGDQGQTLVYDGKHGKLLASKASDAKGPYLLNVYGSTGDTYYGIIQDGASYYETMISNGFPKADVQTEAAIRQNNPILISYRMD